MLKLKWCSARWCCRWSSSVAHRVASLSVSAWSTTASGVDNAASRLADTAERDYFTLRERLITMQNNWKEPRSILMSSVDRVAHIDGHPCNYCEHTHALPAEYKCAQSNKTEQSIYECLLGFCFNNIFSAATNFGCIDSFLPTPRNEEMMGDGFWCYCCRFVLNSKRLLSTSCNK